MRSLHILFSKSPVFRFGSGKKTEKGFLPIVQRVFLSLAWIYCFSSCDTKTDIRYTVSSEPWDEALGNHRAIVEVGRAAPAVYLDILWRRHDKDPGDKRFIIIHEETADTIQYIHRLSVDQERCILVFGPVHNPGVHHLYYLPYKPDDKSGFYRFGYLEREPGADERWIADNGLRDSSMLAEIPGARCAELQARTAFDSFFPMEVIPTASEKKAFLAALDADYLLFVESRENPIRMQDELPLKWLDDGVADIFMAEALKNEYFTFQVGVYAGKKDVENVTVEFSDLKGRKGTIEKSKLTCFNTGGTDPYGKRFSKEVGVPQGMVQPLWIGMDIPEEIPSGRYRGTIEIRPENADVQSLAIELKVMDEVLADRGDGSPTLHSRLRWLNSSLGIDDRPVSRHHAIKALGDMRYELNGKSLWIAPQGFPGSIASGNEQILQNPMSFVVESEDGIIAYSEPQDEKLLKNEPGVMAASWRNRSKNIELLGQASIESDGYLNYHVTVHALEDVALKDVRLEVPFAVEVAEYMMGMGLPGTEVPDDHRATWEGPQDSFWVGNTRGGLWIELRGSDYHGPLLNLYRPSYPDSWYNDDKGGFAIKKGATSTTATVFSGSRSLHAGDKMTFEWSMLVTPVASVDTHSQFADRYYHNGHNPMPSEPELGSGVQIINLHHGNGYNPYLNYPFIALPQLKGFVDELHAKGRKVNLYYTIRELTNLTTEIWALRSLGFEILGSGRGGGFPWLQEHMVDGYRPQWYHPFRDKNHDASIVNAPGDSRWNNYYIESLAWLVRNVGIDGLYLDDVTFDRRIMKRIRKVLDREKPGCLIDLHSNTGFSKGPAMQYAEYFPYIDKLWFGESFRYDEMPPANWLVEVSGIPFGLMGDMLHAGGNPWRGMVYGMTVRYPWYTEGVTCDPRSIWRVWDDFGIADARMVGYWQQKPLVVTTHADVKTTAYIRNDRLLISVASWAPTPVTAKLDIDWGQLGIHPSNVVFTAPEIERFQEERTFSEKDPIPIGPEKGWLLYVDWDE